MSNSWPPSAESTSLSSPLHPSGVMAPRPLEIRTKSIGLAGRAYRQRQFVIGMLWVTAVFAVMITGMAVLFVSGGALLLWVFFLALLWGVYYAGTVMMASAVRHVCPWCSKFLPSTQAWTCPTCQTQHQPPKSPSMFSGCPTCRKRPALYQCPHCTNVVLIDDDQPVTGMEQCAVAHGQRLVTPKEAQIQEMQLESKLQQTMIQMMDNQLAAADKSVKLKKAMVRAKEGPRAAGFAEQSDLLEEREGRRRSIVAHFAALRREAMEVERLRDDALTQRIAEIDTQEREALARAGI